MKSVLLTGATGFIGQRLQKALLDDDYSVTAVVRPSSLHKTRLLPGTTALPADLDEQDKLAPALTEADAVIYCAGTVRGREPDDFKAANVSGISTWVSLMNKTAPDTPFLLVSSLAASRPQVSDYARSKFEGEQELTLKAQFPWCVIRPPAVYGPGDTEMLPILKLARKGLVTPTGPKEQRVSLIYVDDIAGAILTWLQKEEQCRGQIFSLDDGQPNGYSWQDIAKIASGGRHFSVRVPRWLLFSVARINAFSSRVFGYSPMLTPGKATELTQPDWLCNNASFTEATDWTPDVDLKLGIQTLFKKNP